MGEGVPSDLKLDAKDKEDEMFVVLDTQEESKSDSELNSMTAKPIVE